MSEKEEIGRCWVVRWRMEEESSVLQNFLQVLPWRWKSEKVEEYYSVSIITLRRRRFLRELAG